MISEYYRLNLQNGVSPQMSYILDLCDVDTGIDVGTLAAALEIDPPAISAMLKRMDASGLTRRTILPEDRRHTLVFLTEAGRQLRDGTRKDMMLADEDLRRYVSSEDLDFLVALVDRIKIATKEARGRQQQDKSAGAR